MIIKIYVYYLVDCHDRQMFFSPARFQKVFNNLQLSPSTLTCSDSADFICGTFCNSYEKGRASRGD